MNCKNCKWCELISEERETNGCDVISYEREVCTSENCRFEEYRESKK